MPGVGKVGGNQNMDTARIQRQNRFQERQQAGHAYGANRNVHDLDPHQRGLKRGRQKREQRRAGLESPPVSSTETVAEAEETSAVSNKESNMDRVQAMLLELHEKVQTESAALSDRLCEKFGQFIG